MSQTQVTISELTSDPEKLLSHLKLKYAQIYSAWAYNFCEEGPSNEETEDSKLSELTEQPTTQNTEYLQEIALKFITPPSFLYG